MSLLTFVASTACLTISAASSGEMNELPSCGVMAVYAVVHHHSGDASLSDVQSLLADGDKKGHSLHELNVALHALGMHSRTVVVTPQSVSQLALPSIIYFRPDRMGPEYTVGHCLVLEAITPAGARLLDLTQTPEAMEVPLDELFSNWDGECVEVSRHPFLASYYTGWTMFWALISLLSAIAVWCRRKPIGLSLGQCCIVVIGAVGCSASSVEISPLRFEDREFDAGVVPRGPDAKVECRFAVGPKPVVLTAVDTNCSCISASQDLVGQTLAPESKHAFEVKLHTVGRFGVFGGLVTVHTDLPGKRMVECYVSACVDGPPEAIETVPYKMEATLGKPSQVVISLEHFRPHGKEAVEWDAERSDLAGFSLLDNAHTSDSYTSLNGSLDGDGMRDVFRWTLASPKDLPVGAHRSEVVIAWKKESYPPARLPVSVLVRHPIATSLDRVFFGVVPKGNERSACLLLTVSGPDSIDALAVHSDSPFIGATLDAAAQCIHVTLSPECPVGRLSSTLRVSHRMLPLDLVIPVSVIVIDKPLASVVP